MALSFFFTLVGWSCCARRRLLTASSDSASIEPLRSSPPRARASQANSAIDRYSTAKRTTRPEQGSKNDVPGRGGRAPDIAVRRAETPGRGRHERAGLAQGGSGLGAGRKAGGGRRHGGALRSGQP